MWVGGGEAFGDCDSTDKKVQLKFNWFVQVGTAIKLRPLPVSDPGALQGCPLTKSKW